MPLLSILHAGAERSLVNRSGWYDTLLFTSYIIWKWQSVASPYVAQFTYGHISRFARRYLGEAEFQHSGQYLHFGLPAANVTSHHRCWMDYDMICFGRDIDIVCIMHGVYQSTTTTTTSTNYDLYQLLRQLLYSSFLLSSVMDTLYSAALCCLYARWNQSPDA